jgi:GTPase KRas protein
VVIDGQACILDILDTGDQEQYAALVDQWIRYGEGFVLVYSVTDRGSFERISTFHNRIERVTKAFATRTDDSVECAPVMLVANKIDRAADSEVATIEGQNLARDLRCDFVETSAKNNINVERAFYHVVRDLRRQRLAAKNRMLDASQNSSEGLASDLHGPKQHRREKSKGVPRVWEKVKARAS